VRLPDVQMHTTAFWLVVPEGLCAELAERGAALGERWSRAAAIDGLRGIGSALETVATLHLMCDPRDLGRAMGDEDDDVAARGRAEGEASETGLDPTLFLFDNVPGGVGLSERIW